jgi:hypothetical protein
MPYLVEGCTASRKASSVARAPAGVVASLISAVKGSVIIGAWKENECLVALLVAAMVLRRLLIGLALVRLGCGGMILGE